jgi:hypothetical protein
MTRDDIIRMARSAGLVGLEQGGILENFQRFAALVAAAEREACAKVCEDLDESDTRFRHDYMRGTLDCAEAIRARGEQEQPR